MSANDVLRAWKDPMFRAALSPEERARVGHPSGNVDVTDSDIRQGSGLAGVIVTTFRTCTEYTNKRFHCC